MDYRNQIIDLLSKAGTLKVGEELLVPFHTKADCKIFERQLHRELQILATISVEDATSLVTIASARDGMFWLTIRKVKPPMTIVFKRDLEGNTSRITLGRRTKEENDED